MTILLYLASVCLVTVSFALPPQQVADVSPQSPMDMWYQHVVTTGKAYEHNNKTSFETRQRGVKRLVQNAFVVYKTFISSQDHMSCVFSPSCSEYALQAMQKQGFFPGLLNTFDRLTRCNGLRPGDYVIDPRLRLLSDPVRNMHYETL